MLRLQGFVGNLRVQFVEGRKETHVTQLLTAMTAMAAETNG
jgi:hypothetical protein